MSQYDESQCYKIGPKMVCYKNELFSVHFPKNLYESVLNCNSCKCNGMWNGCIIMQCVKCSNLNLEKDESEFYGALAPGIEFNKEHPNSASNTYLKNVDLDNVGDIYLENSRITNSVPLYENVKIYGNNYLINRTCFPYSITKNNDEDIDIDDSDVDSMPELITYDEYINRFTKNDDIIDNINKNPLHGIMDWDEVLEEFKKWKKCSRIETNETCMEWATRLKSEWEINMRETGEIYKYIPISTQEEIDLQNQTGIFDFTPCNYLDSEPNIHKSIIDCDLIHDNL